MLSRAENNLAANKQNTAPLSRQAALKKNVSTHSNVNKPLGLAATKAASTHAAPAKTVTKNLVSGNKENAENELPQGKNTTGLVKKTNVPIRTKKAIPTDTCRITRSRTTKNAAPISSHSVSTEDENAALAKSLEFKNLKKRNAAKEPKYASEPAAQNISNLDTLDKQVRAGSKSINDENVHVQEQSVEILTEKLSARSKRLKFEMEAPGSFPDIDEEDEEDPAMCAAYAQEIMDYLMDREKFFMPSDTYISQHPELKWNMRTILVDWLVEVHQKFRFLPETLFLAVNIMDRFLSRRVCSLNKFQLVGLASLFIAAKTEEVVCPPVQQFSFMADNAFTDDDMLRAEQYILRVLDFNIWAPGPFSFLRRISKVDDYNVNHRTLAKYFAEISLLDHRFLAIPPSLVAASSMLLARKLHGEEGWDRLFTYVAGYTEEELGSTVELIVDWLCKPPEPDSFFYRKYSARKYGRASQAAYNWARETQMAFLSDKKRLDSTEDKNDENDPEC